MLIYIFYVFPVNWWFWNFFGRICELAGLFLEKKMHSSISSATTFANLNLTCPYSSLRYFLYYCIQWLRLLTNMAANVKCVIRLLYKGDVLYQICSSCICIYLQKSRKLLSRQVYVHNQEIWSKVTYADPKQNKFHFRRSYAAVCLYRLTFVHHFVILLQYLQNR